MRYIYKISLYLLVNMYMRSFPCSKPFQVSPHGYPKESIGMLPFETC